MLRGHKVIITGTGRAGTTFLVQLLTELGLDTGYTPGKWGRDYHEHCSAGLEKDIFDLESPYIVKNPVVGTALAALLAHKAIVIDHALIPVRRLDDAASSRIRIGGGDGSVPGGLTGTKAPAQQKSVLAERFHELVETLVEYDIPHTFLHFPRFACDSEYAFEKLQPVLNGIAHEHFEACFRRVSRPELIHTFDGAQVGKPGAIGRGLLQSSRRRRYNRRILRFAAVAAILALGWFFGPHIGDDDDAKIMVEAPLPPALLVSQAVPDQTAPLLHATVNATGPGFALRRSINRVRSFSAPSR